MQTRVTLVAFASFNPLIVKAYDTPSLIVTDAELLHKGIEGRILALKGRQKPICGCMTQTNTSLCIQGVNY